MLTKEFIGDENGEVKAVKTVRLEWCAIPLVPSARHSAGEPTHAHTRMHVRTHAHAHTPARAHTHTHAHTHAYVRTHARAHTHTHSYIQQRARTCTLGRVCVSSVRFSVVVCWGRLRALPSCAKLCALRTTKVHGQEGLQENARNGQLGAGRSRPRSRSPLDLSRTRSCDSGLPLLPQSLRCDALQTFDANLVLLSMGFVGPEETLVRGMGLSHDAKGNIKARHAPSA